MEYKTSMANASVARDNNSFLNSTTFEDPCKLEGLSKFAEDFERHHGALSLTVAIAGIIFNLLNIIVLSHPKMRNPVNLLLTMLSCLEFLLLVFYVPFITLFNLSFPADAPRYHSTSQSASIYLLFYASASVFLHTASFWMIITTACFRYLFVQFPLHSAKWCSYQRAVVAGIATIVASFLITLPNMLRNSILPMLSDNLSYPCSIARKGQIYFTITHSELFQKHKQLEDITIWSYAALGKFLPTILLLIFTIFLICILRDTHTRRKRLHTNHRKLSEQSMPNEHSQTTRMLLAVVILFIGIELPHGIIIIYTSLTGTGYIYEKLGNLIDLLTLTAFSINFIMNCTMSKQYRQLFLKLIRTPLQAKLQLRKIRVRYSRCQNVSGRLSSDHRSISKHIGDSDSCALSITVDSNTIMSTVQGEDE